MTPAAAETPAPDDHAAVLDLLIGDGLAVTRLTRLRANAEADSVAKESREDAAISAQVASDLATAYDLAARAVRRAILLSRSPAKPPASHPASAKSPEQRAAARKRILRDVEDAIDSSAPRPTDAACLHAELLDRLDSPDLEDDIENLQVETIIENICRDLALARAIPGRRPWRRRTPEDIDLLAARAAAAPKPRPPESSDPERLFRLVPTPNAT